MYEVAVIGERESVLGFLSLGFRVFEAEDVEAARAHLHALAKNDSFAVIFIVENYARALEEDIAAYRDRPLPAIICIPGREGSTGYGLANIKSAVQRAVGADILFKNE